jgi:signal transduction histidine kinase
MKFAVLFTDITERIKKNIELSRALCHLEQADELKSQFLHDINHRLRTPLNGMMGMLQLVDRKQMNDDNAELFEAMALEMKHTRNIINQIAKYIDIQSMTTHYSLEILQDIITDAAQAVDEKTRDYESIMTEWVIKNMSDSQSYIEKDIIDKVFKEIYLNAKKHTLEDRITVSIENEWHQEAGLYYVGITITDYGEGIDKDKIKLIFNEFYHHDFVNIYRDEERYSVPMCKQMMLRCGGDLIVDSQVNVGTSFTMIIPAYKDEMNNSNQTLEGGKYK